MTFALAKRADEMGVKVSIGVVDGDDLRHRVYEFRAQDHRDMFSGVPFPDTVLSINAYLGGFPIAAALAEGADIVVTGRVVDSTLILGPLIHEFGWNAGGGITRKLRPNMDLYVEFRYLHGKHNDITTDTSPITIGIRW